jgi:hypothetical protein
MFDKYLAYHSTDHFHHVKHVVIPPHGSQRGTACFVHKRPTRTQQTPAGEDGKMGQVPSKDLGTCETLGPDWQRRISGDGGVWRRGPAAMTRNG